MTDISATDAARQFSDLLDGVEHRGEHYTIHRHGKAVAELHRTRREQGREAKHLLRSHRPDPDWRPEVDAVRALLAIEERE